MQGAGSQAEVGLELILVALLLLIFTPLSVPTAAPQRVGALITNYSPSR